MGAYESAARSAATATAGGRSQTEADDAAVSQLKAQLERMSQQFKAEAKLAESERQELLQLQVLLWCTAVMYGCGVLLWCPDLAWCGPCKPHHGGNSAWATLWIWQVFQSHAPSEIHCGPYLPICRRRCRG